MDAAGVGSAVANLTTSSALALAGLLALGMASSRGRSAAPLRPLTAMVAGVGLVALAADEGLELHDRIGRWLWHEHRVAAPGPVNHVDDLFVMAYLACGAAAMAVSARSLLRHRRFVALCALAGALVAAGTAFDAFGTPGSWTEAPEEAGEAAGAIVLAIAFWPHAGTRVLARRPAVPLTALPDGLRATGPGTPA